MKRKILVAILAVAMIAGTLAAPLAQVFAAGTEKNVAGTWYGSSMGIPITMDVLENGTYKVSVDDGNEEEGVWTVENDEFVMDKDTDYEMSLQFDGDSIFLDEEDGINFEFEREPAEKETEEVKEDVKESDFFGVWKANTVNFESISSNPEILGAANVFAEIKKGKASLYITDSNILSPINLVDMKTEFEKEFAGVLLIDITEDDATDNTSINVSTIGEETADNTLYDTAVPNNKCEFYFTESGQLKMRLTVDGSIILFDMEKSNQKKLTKAKSGTCTVEVKADEKETKTGKTTTETVEEYIGEAKNNVTTES